ncbi:hypothetical protein [Plantactinospora sonchi]|uniref:HTH cro/C1-type domain-containing protein n=1 Tax=Plantactinospora sonchi TaxID=1544735 RepID=A0ABU7RWV7_9ACTN
MTDQTTETGTPIQEEPAVQEEAHREAGLRVLQRRKELGVSRAALAALSGLTAAKVWRCEDGRPLAEELLALEEALSRVERDGLPEQMRPRRAKKKPVRAAEHAALIQRLQRVETLLGQAIDAKTRKDVNDLLAEAQLVISGEPMGETEKLEVTEDDDETTGEPVGDSEAS